jgi:hypothetical protein
MCSKSTDAAVASALCVVQARLTAGSNAEAHTHTHYLKPHGAHVCKRGDGHSGGAPYLSSNACLRAGWFNPIMSHRFGDGCGPFPEKSMTEMSVARLIKVGTEFRAEKRH